MGQKWKKSVDPLPGKKGEGGAGWVALAAEQVEVELTHGGAEGVDGRDVGVVQGGVVGEGGRVGGGGRRAGSGRHVVAAGAVAEVAAGCRGGGGGGEQQGSTVHAFPVVVVS